MMYVDRAIANYRQPLVNLHAYKHIARGITLKVVIVRLTWNVNHNIAKKTVVLQPAQM